MACAAPLELPAALTAAGISLRPVAEGDFPFLRHLFRTLRWAELAPTLWPDEAKVAFLDQQFAFQHRHYTSGFAAAEFYLVARQAEPIGRFYIDRETRHWYLIEISLLPDWRGRGLGAALVGLAAGRGPGRPRRSGQPQRRDDQSGAAALRPAGISSRSPRPTSFPASPWR